MCWPHSSYLHKALCETLCDGYMITIKKIIECVALAKQGGNALDIIRLSGHLSVTTPMQLNKQQRATTTITSLE